MHIPDNNDVFTAFGWDINREFRLDRGVSSDEERADDELPWVTVPNDYGTHDRDLYEVDK